MSDNGIDITDKQQSSAAVQERVQLNLLDLSSVNSASLGVDFMGAVSSPPFSGSIIRFDNSKGSDNALVLTNGHAVIETPVPTGGALVDVPSNREFRVIPSDGESRSPGLVKAEKLVYATMTDTDIAIYRLNESYDEIEKRLATKALTLSRQPARLGDSVSVVSGYWRYKYSCQIAGIVPRLQEDSDFYSNSIKYSPDCRMTGGVSGSPIISNESKQVIGVHNTSSGDGEACSRGNPCELGEDGSKHAKKSVSYGQQTSQIYSCLDSENNLNLSSSSCKLPKKQALK